MHGQNVNTRRKHRRHSQNTNTRRILCGELGGGGGVLSYGASTVALEDGSLASTNTGEPTCCELDVHIPEQLHPFDMDGHFRDDNVPNIGSH